MALMLASGKTDPTRNAAVLWALAALQMVLGSALAYGADPTVCMPWVAKIVGVQGQVDTRRAGEVLWRPVRLEETFCGGDMVRVSGRSRAAILLRENETTLRLDQRTTITIPRAAPTAPLWLELLRGAANFLSRTPISLKIRTPFLNAHIEGTEFLVRVEEDRTSILVFSGAVLAENSAGSVKLQSGEKAVATASQAPNRSLLIRPRDAVVWALYYPPIIDYRAAAYASSNVRHLRDTLSLYRQGKLVEALARLDSVPPSERDNPYFDLRAGLLLSVGRLDEAGPAIDQALSRNPKDGTALALTSIMTLVRNNKDEALSLAQEAAAIEPRSAVPHIALSYVRQARFEFDEALAALNEALRLAPEDALVHARLAELELSRGNLDRALTSAERAAKLSPQLSRTQTVLGFAYLTQIKTKRAKVAFQEAIRLDSTDPLARLGLGLAMIREGKVKDGTRELEIAVSLDPNTALMRSYLGKAYYEQKRGTLAATEYNHAKTLDPQDPTPWFYDAILKQATNRPVEALEDLQGAIERNDNRLVYRSRLLLDSDLAARSANLGRTYSDLGFGQRALVEGWKSLTADPSDYSGHRFLADTYSVLPRHGLARASELLQSQLLQPVNLTPMSTILPSSSRPLLQANQVGPC